MNSENTSCKPRFWNAETPNPMAKVTRVFGISKGNVQQIGEFYYKDDADYAMHASSNHQDLVDALEKTVGKLKSLVELCEEKGLPDNYHEYDWEVIRNSESVLKRAKGEKQ